MKRLAFLFAFSLFLLQGALTQTGAIKDRGTYIDLIYPDSSKLVSISKSQVESLMTVDGEVYVITSKRWGTGQLSKISSLTPGDFGYNSAGDLSEVLKPMFFNSYRLVYSYGSSGVDTITHYAGDTLAYKIAYSYSGGNISEKSAPINE